jgi:hypothetical protein
MNIHETIKERKEQNDNINTQKIQRRKEKLLRIETESAERQLKVNKEFLNDLPLIIAKVLVGLSTAEKKVPGFDNIHKDSILTAALIIAEIDYEVTNFVSNDNMFRSNIYDNDRHIKGEYISSLYKLTIKNKQHPNKLKEALHIFTQVELDKDIFLKNLANEVSKVSPELVEDSFLYKKSSLSMSTDFNFVYVLDEIYLNHLIAKEKSSILKIIDIYSEKIPNTEIKDSEIRIPEVIKRDDLSKPIPDVKYPKQGYMKVLSWTVFTILLISFIVIFG